MRETPKKVLTDLFRVPSTRGGRIRLLGLGTYAALTILVPTLPHAVKQAVVEILGRVL